MTRKPIQIIVIEDNDNMRLGLCESLRREGCNVQSFAAGKEALDFFKTNSVPLVITDLRMEGFDGLQVLEKVKALNPKTEVLLISAYGTVEDAVKAMHLGAADFLTKPFSPDELRVRVKKILEKIETDQLLDRLQAEQEYLREEISNEFEHMVGASHVMREIFTIIERVAGEESAVLIEGESGTGKELAARAIHRKSPRAEGPFVKVNCGALNDNLLESELFGHEKGSFTGAVKQKKGRFELANSGTIFLDEIGDVSPALQVKLLRPLQEKEFERVGGEITLKVDVRVIAATNRDLQVRISEGEFREDLYYRLSVIPIRMPALRERTEDIPLLVHHFLDAINRLRGITKKISNGGIRLLQEYSWPGNIRELENLIERLHVISSESEIDETLVARYLIGVDHGISNFMNIPLNDAIYAFEKKLITHALKKADGVKNRAAKLLGIQTSDLYYKLEKFGLLK